MRLRRRLLAVALVTAVPAAATGLAAGVAAGGGRAWPMALVALAGGAGVVLVALVAARWAARPLEAERDAAAEHGDRERADLVARVGALEEQRHLLLSAVRGMREGLLVVGPDRRVRFANPAASELLAGDGGDPVGRLLAELVRDPTILADVDAALRQGREVRDSVVRAADSGRAFELHVRPLRDGGALVLFVDVTRLEALESVRREFVANVSHELRTPLTSITAFLETLLDGAWRDPEAAPRFLRVAQESAARMTALVEDLTDLSLIETGAVAFEPGEVDLAEVVEGVLAQMSRRAEERQVSLVSSVDRPFPLRADRRRIEQVLVNLVDNAIKFNRPGGAVRVAAARAADRAVVTVEDTGMGIPSTSLDKVFHRFYRVDPARARTEGGTGLGLAIVKHLMRLHGGTVRVESELGRGSRFVLELPA